MKLYYWYHPYFVHVAYPQLQQVARSTLEANNLTGIPNDSNPYPPVDPTRLHQSATYSMELTKHANQLVTEISQSTTFAKELMTAAQKSDQRKVDEMIASVGIPSKVTTKYTPSGIRFVLHKEVDGAVCCEVSMILNW